jgi:hypothetical protein
LFSLQVEVGRTSSPFVRLIAPLPEDVRVYACLPHHNLCVIPRIHHWTIESIVVAVTSDSSFLQNGCPMIFRGVTPARRPTTEQTRILERRTSIQAPTIWSTRLLPNRTIPRWTRYLGVLEHRRFSLVLTKSRSRSHSPTLGNTISRGRPTQLLKRRNTRRLRIRRPLPKRLKRLRIVQQHDY